MNLLTELKKIYPTNKIEIKEKYIENILEIPDPNFKQTDESPYDIPMIKEDNSIREYIVFFDEKETTAKLWINVKHQEYDLIDNVGTGSVNLIHRKIEEWKKQFFI